MKMKSDELIDKSSWSVARRLFNGAGRPHWDAFFGPGTLLSSRWWFARLPRQKTAKQPHGLGVKFPCAHLSTTDGGGFTLFFNVERQAEKLWKYSVLQFCVDPVEFRTVLFQTLSSNYRLEWKFQFLKKNSNEVNFPSWIFRKRFTELFIANS